MNSFIKQSSEEYAISISLANTLETSETISNIDISVIDHNRNTVTSTIIDSSTYDDDSVEIKVKNGTTETKYKITIVITSSLDYIYEEDVYMEVIDF